MSKRNHQSTIQGVLRSQGLNTPDGAIYAGAMHERMEDDCIAIVETGGPQPGDMMGTTESIQKPHVQVLVRADDKTQGKSDADDVWRIVHDWDGGTDYSRATMLQPTPLGPDVDDDGRYRWSINAELFISE